MHAKEARQYRMERPQQRPWCAPAQSRSQGIAVSGNELVFSWQYGL
jgi:hypothetical protein